MLVLLVHGMPVVGQALLEELANSLMASTSAILGIRPEEVSVFYPVDRMRKGLGEELVCFVEGLFPTSDRTKEVRQRLAHALETILSDFARGNIPAHHFVQVFVKQFDPQKDCFATCEFVLDRK